MSKSVNKSPTESKAQEDAWKIAKGTQRPGQTKEQTKLIAQGIKKGIDLYKKQQSAKERELDKQRKKQLKQREAVVEVAEKIETRVEYKQHWLPWSLLLLSWIGFGVYFFM